MSWYGWLALTISLLGWFATMRRVAWLVANELDSGDDPDGELIAFGLFVGALAGLAWPIILPGFLLHQHGLLIGSKHALLKPPKAYTQSDAQKMHKRIDELERELGITRVSYTSWTHE